MTATSTGMQLPPANMPPETGAVRQFLVRAGVSPATAASVSGDLTPQRAEAILSSLGQTAAALRAYGPRMLLLQILRRVVAGGRNLTLAAFQAEVARHGAIVVARPDGYLARVQTGEPVARIGRVELRGDGLYAGNARVGELYHYDGQLHRVDANLAPIGPPIDEVGLQHDLPNQVLDGVEASLRGTVEGIAHMIRRGPIRTITDLTRLPGAIAMLIRHSPEYWEHFRNMTPDDQVRAVSQLLTTLVTMYAGGSGVATTIGGGGAAGGTAMVRALRLLGNGTLAEAMVPVRVGTAATALGHGAGAIYILHMANNAADRANGAPGGDGSTPEPGSSPEGAGPQAPPASGRPTPRVTRRDSRRWDIHWGGRTEVRMTVDGGNVRLTYINNEDRLFASAQELFEEALRVARVQRPTRITSNAIVAQSARLQAWLRSWPEDAVLTGDQITTGPGLIFDRQARSLGGTLRRMIVHDRQGGSRRVTLEIEYATPDQGSARGVASRRHRARGPS